MWLEQRIDEGRDGGGLGENQEHSYQEQEYQDRQQPPLLAHLQEFTKLQNYPDFTHLGVSLGSNLSEHKKCYNDEPFCEMMRILGISAYYHDSAACLLEEGPIVAALQEERLSRIKHDSSFPSRSIEAILRIGNCEVSDLDYLVFYEKPFVKLERILET